MTIDKARCCGTCDKSIPLYVNTVQTCYCFCQLRKDNNVKLKSYEACEKYNPKEETVELKLCPFCGGSAFIAKEIYPTGEEAWHVLHWENGNCFINNTINGDYDTEEEAIEAWNRRAENG